MQISFDLISDLHLTSNDYDYQGLATSPICVIAGNISDDRSITINFLKHISNCYQQVLFIDGNAEHVEYDNDYPESIDNLKQQISKIKKVQYLHEDVVVVNDVAFVGTNGWWNFTFNPDMDDHQVREWYKEQTNNCIDPDYILLNAVNDATYLVHTVKKLQTHKEVKKIILITNSVPTPELISHDIELLDNYKFNVMGNELLDSVKLVDTESKIHTWCFGRYDGVVDQIIDNVRYVNHSRGMPDSSKYQYVYYPKKITINN